MLATFAHFMLRSVLTELTVDDFSCLGSLMQSLLASVLLRIGLGLLLSISVCEKNALAVRMTDRIGRLLANGTVFGILGGARA